MFFFFIIFYFFYISLPPELSRDAPLAPLRPSAEERLGGLFRALRLLYPGVDERHQEGGMCGQQERHAPGHRVNRRLVQVGEILVRFPHPVPRSRGFFFFWHGNSSHQPPKGPSQAPDPSQAPASAPEYESHMVIAPVTGRARSCNPPDLARQGLPGPHHTVPTG